MLIILTHVFIYDSSMCLLLKYLLVIFCLIFDFVFPIPKTSPKIFVCFSVPIKYIFHLASYETSLLQIGYHGAVFHVRLGTLKKS